MYLQSVWVSCSFWCQDSEKFALTGASLVSVEQPLARFTASTFTDNSTCLEYAADSEDKQ